MRKSIFATCFLCFVMLHASAQLGVMKMVGKNTKDYLPGFGAFLKGGYPVSEGSTATLEIGVNIFFLRDGSDGANGTAMCPLKAGYRYTLNHSGSGLYIEPQAGFNLYGVTSLYDEEGKSVDLKYHGIVLAAGTGYLFTVWEQPFDLNFRYETVIAHGGSNNLISLGISRFIRFRRRNRDN